MAKEFSYEITEELGIIGNPTDWYKEVIGFLGMRVNLS